MSECVELVFAERFPPQTNGKPKRFIQTLLREWAYAAPYETSPARRQQLCRTCATTSADDHTRASSIERRGHGLRALRNEQRACP